MNWMEEFFFFCNMQQLRYCWITKPQRNNPISADLIFRQHPTISYLWVSSDCSVITAYRNNRIQMIHFLPCSSSLSLSLSVRLCVDSCQRDSEKDCISVVAMCLWFFSGIWFSFINVYVTAIRTEYDSNRLLQQPLQYNRVYFFSLFFLNNLLCGRPQPSIN